MNEDQPGARLDGFDKTEWRDVVRTLRPDITDAEYDVMWDENMARKEARLRQRSLH